MKTSFVKHRMIRNAFTLVELIVVLTILVGLGRRLNSGGNGHDWLERIEAQSAINISEVAGAIQRYDAQYMTYPNNFDSLMFDDGTWAS